MKGINKFGNGVDDEDGIVRIQDITEWVKQQYQVTKHTHRTLKAEHRT